MWCVVGVGGGRMMDGGSDGCLSAPRGDGTMVTWEGDHMAASMSYPCHVAVGGLPRPSPACRSLAVVVVCVDICCCYGRFEKGRFKKRPFGGVVSLSPLVPASLCCGAGER